MPVTSGNSVASTPPLGALRAAGAPGRAACAALGASLRRVGAANGLDSAVLGATRPLGRSAEPSLCTALAMSSGASFSSPEADRLRTPASRAGLSNSSPAGPSPQSNSRMRCCCSKIVASAPFTSAALRRSSSSLSASSCASRASSSSIVTVGPSSLPPFSLHHDVCLGQWAQLFLPRSGFGLAGRVPERAWIKVEWCWEGRPPSCFSPRSAGRAGSKRPRCARPHLRARLRPPLSSMATTARHRAPCASAWQALRAFPARGDGRSRLTRPLARPR